METLVGRRVSKKVRDRERKLEGRRIRRALNAPGKVNMGFPSLFVEVGTPPLGSSTPPPQGSSSTTTTAGQPAAPASATPAATKSANEMPSSIRFEVLTKLRDNAGNHFFRAWADNVDAMDIFREWLKAGAARKDDGALEETIMPLLHVSC